MPLYMDRHDLRGATGEEVAAAHARDLDLSSKHDVEFMAYWFDAQNGTAFCFAKAPRPEEMQAVHSEAHGLVANKIIAVSEDNVLRFLGQVHNPADATEATRAFRVVLFTDLEGSTSLLEGAGEAAYMVLLTEHDLIIRRALVAAHGREVKHTGDGIMAAFDDVPDALECSAAIQDGFDARTAGGEIPALRVRIGVAAGEPVDRNDDLFGSTVNLASRLCNAADAGQILVSDIVHDMGVKGGFSLHDAGTQLLKGFSGPVQVFELLRQARGAASAT